MGKTVRIDKWLWAIRLYKTRSQATDACKSGRVKIGDMPQKPSKEIKEGQEIIIHKGPLRLTIKVLALTDKRIGAKLVPGYMLDLTPADEYKKLEHIRENPLSKRKGRPTKRERRELDQWFGWDE